MTSIHDLATPTLLVDLDRLESNVRRMADKARGLAVSLRPHIKTHKCVEVARLQQREGCRGLTVSTLAEAAVFADHGFGDLTWAFPLIINRLDQARKLSERVTLRLVIDSAVALEALVKAASPFRVWLKVDCGYHRAGVDPAGDQLLRLVGGILDSRELHFDGLLTHAGHAYAVKSLSELEQVAHQERDVMLAAAARLHREGVRDFHLSIGSTPTMSVVGDLHGIDEMRPGNYVFYDDMQVALGACTGEECALSVLASVVSCRQGSAMSVIDAGALALSKDGDQQTQTYGRLVGGNARVTSLSQEHGILSAPLPVGSKVRILPHHSCLTAACFDEYTVVRGEEVVDHWPIHRGR